MSQLSLFEPEPPDANTVKVKALERRRKSKPLSRKKDPSSSHKAGQMFRESGGVQTHEDIILTALYRLGKATGHELVKEIAGLFPERPLSHTQVMRRTGAMVEVEGGECRACVCGGKCQELSLKKIVL